jgi:hypothetical protein
VKSVLLGVCACGVKIIDVSDKPVYANLLTRLFEFIAKLVDDQGGMVQDCFGEGYLLIVMQRLQRQAELQGNIILDAFIGECCFSNQRNKQHF